MHILGKLRSWLQALGLALRTVRVPVRQQFQTTECGVAALAMVLAHHGRHVSNETLREVTGVSRDCVNAADILRAARHFGLDCKAYTREPHNLGDLPLPFLAHFRFIHFMVVEGFADGGVLTVDPASGRSYVPAAQFDEAFTGVVLTFKPGERFQPGGAPVHPVSAWWARVANATWRPASVALGAGLAGVLALPVIAVLLGRWLDALAVQPLAMPWAVPLGLVAVALVSGGLLAWARSASVQMQEALARVHARELVTHYLALPAGFFAYRLPSRLHDMLYAGDAAAGLLCRDLFPGLLRLALAPVAVVLMTLLYPAAGLLSVAVLLVHAGLTAATLRWHRLAPQMRGKSQEGAQSQLFSRSQLEMAKLNAYAREFVAVRLGGQAASMASQQESAGLQAWLQGASAAVAFGLPLLTLVLVAQGQADGVVTSGTALSLVLLACAAGAAQRGAWQLALQWSSLVHLLLPVQDVLESKPVTAASNDASTGAAGATSPPDGVLLRASDLVFGYSLTRQPLVSGICLDLHCGEQLGITGPSGGGKSTLGALLSGDHVPWSGRVELAAALRSGSRGGVARVDKTGFFFEGKVRENLCLWDASVTEADLARAVQDACLDEVLAARPGGLDASVAPRGENFSGGQRQRMEIARALLRDPQVLVLDEATDALDPPLEARLRANIRARGCALVMISHRASTLAACDRVLRVAAGRLSEAPPAATAAGGSPFTPEGATPALREALGPAGPPVILADDDDLCAQADCATLQAGLQRIALALGLGAVQAEPAPEGADLFSLGGRAGLVLRRVRFINANWWAWNHGALLACCRAQARVVVWLPGQPGGWTDALTGEPLAIDPQRDLHEVAWRCLPLASDAPTRAPDRIRRAMQSVAGEWWMASGIALLLAALLLALPMFAVRALVPGAVIGPGQWAGAIAAALAVGLLEYLLVRALLRIWSQVDGMIMSAFVQRLPRLAPPFLRGVSDRALGRSLGALEGLLKRLSAATRPALEGIVPLFALGFLAFWHTGLALLGAASAAVICAVHGYQPAGTAKREEALLQQRGAEVRFLFDALAGLPRLRLLGSCAAALVHWQELLASNQLQGRPLRALEHAPGWRRLSWGWLILALVPAALALAPGQMASLTHQAGAVWWLPACFMALWLVLESAQGLGQALHAARRCALPVQQANLLCTAPLEPAPAKAVPAGRLELDAVRYAWPGTSVPALRSASLQIEAGEFLAITGPSGSGKSTLLRLMLGLDQPDAGVLTLGGSALDGPLLSAWRATAGLVAQGDTLETAGTLRGQLCGMAQVDAQAVWSAVEAVLMADDVRQMPMGLQTIVETGKLSTGQEQRLLIARELLRQPRFLVLDEATNAIPDPMQAQLFATLRQRGITCVLVTHRETALALMDRVVVVRDGAVAWSGRPHELAGRGDLMDMLRAERQKGHL